MDSDEFSGMETAVIRSAGIDTKSITYAVFTRTAISILIKAYEAIFRTSLDPLPDVPDVHTQARNASILVDALKSNLLFNYPELRVVSVNSLMHKEPRILNVIVSTLFQEGQRIWLEKLKGVYMKTEKSIVDTYGDDEGDPEEPEEEYTPIKSPAARISDYPADEPDIDLDDGDEYAEDGYASDDVEELRKEGQLIRGSMLDAKKKLRRKKRRRGRAPKTSPTASERRRNFVEENAKLLNVRPNKVPPMMQEPFGIRKLRPGSAPPTRSTNDLREGHRVLESKETPRKKKEPGSLERDEYGDAIVYTYDMRSGRRIMLSKAQVDEMERKQALAKNGDVRNMSDLNRDDVNAAKPGFQARAPVATKPSWPGYSTEKSAKEWVAKMRQQAVPETKQVKAPSPPSATMYSAYSRMEPLDMIISIEHCSFCAQHKVSLRHNEDEYLNNANLMMRALTEAVASIRPTIRLGTSVFTGVSASSAHNESGAHIGAFEIQVAFKSKGSGIKVELLHSKIKTMRWPSRSVIVKRLQTLLAQFRLGTLQEAAAEELQIAEYQSGTGLGINDGDNGLRHVQWLFDARTFAPEASNTLQVASVPFPVMQKPPSATPSKVLAKPAAATNPEPVKHPVKVASPRKEVNVVEVEGAADEVEAGTDGPEQMLDELAEDEATTPIAQEAIAFVGRETEPDYASAAIAIETDDEQVDEGTPLDSEQPPVRTIAEAPAVTNPDTKEPVVDFDEFEDDVSGPLEYKSMQLSINSIEIVGKALTTSDFDDVCFRLKLNSHVLTSSMSSSEESRTEKRIFSVSLKNLQITADEFKEGKAEITILQDADFEEAIVAASADLRGFMKPFGVISEVSIPLAHTSGVILAVLKVITSEPQDDVKDRIRKMNPTELRGMKFAPLVSFSQDESETESSISIPVKEASTKKLSSVDESTDPSVSARASPRLPPLKASSATAPALSDSCTIRVNKIVAKGLKRVETSAGGKNDPFMELSCGGRWKAKTSTLSGAGSNATWRFAETNAEMEFPVIVGELGAAKFEVVAMDENILADHAYIGAGGSTLAALRRALPNSDVDIEINLVDSEGSPAGRVVVTFTLSTTDSKVVSSKEAVKEAATEIPIVRQSSLSPLNASPTKVPSPFIAMKADEDDENYDDEFEDNEEEDAPKPVPIESASDNDEKASLLRFCKETGGSNWDIKAPWQSSDPLSKFNGVSVDTEQHVIEISLGRKRLTGLLPDVIMDFQSITVLVLFGNKLTGPLPEELFTLVKLKKLNLYDNGFNGELSPLFSELTSLESLNLSCNGFTGLIPKEMAIPSLRELYLHQNPLRGPVPIEFTTLKNLTDMSCDLIPYSEFNKVFEWIVSSQRLNWEAIYHGEVHENEKVFLDCICDKYTEEFMELNEAWTNWGYRSVQPLHLWRGIQLSKTGNIQSLVLRNCGMHGEIPQAITKLDKLVYLDFSSNSFEGQIPVQFSTLKLLQYLHLDHNQLSGGLHTVFSMKSLKVIDMAHNAFTDELPESMKSLSVLETLKLEHNRITGHIPDDISAIARVRHLDLSHNRLTDDIPVTIGKLRSLKFLNLSYNEVTGVIPREYARCINLEHIHLEETKIDFKAGGNKEEGIKLLRKLLPELKTISI